MVQPAPGFDQQTAEILSRSHFGIEGNIRPLTSERDQNFLIEGADDAWVLKISNAHEDLAVTDFQTRAVNYALERDPELPLPPFLESRSGQLVEVLDSESGRHAVRMLVFVPGIPLKEAVHGQEPTPAFSFILGELLARLARALENMDHPAADHAILWDLTNFPALAPLAKSIADPAETAALTTCFEDYQSHLRSIQSLSRQVIYNDLNDSNVLLDADDPSSIAGLIDFGDVVRAPRIFDVAVAASYRLNDPAGAVDFLNGYASVSPFSALERNLLPLLVRCRLATTILVTQWRAARFPDNRDYILRNYPAAREALLDFDEASFYP